MVTAARWGLRRALVAVVLSLILLATTACGRQGGGAAPAAQAALAGQANSIKAPSGALQEVAPPGAVQQLNTNLNERAPRLEVLAPADNTVLPEGPWTLKLKLQDWPIADAGPLGLGPHVVVQLDDAAPIRLTSPEALAAVPMPELRPGSHRVTVYAARPWGEAVKAPGASSQVRLHRVSRNGAALPAPGSPQLISVGPEGQVAGEPVLLDWLLLDAPLQHLRGDDAQWRLRISVNGDSFLVDRQTPLWLKGFKRGSNALQLELLDGRGDPLNPPFNSLVREVVIDGGTRPAWLKPSLNAEELARLSGEAPPEPAPQPEPEPEPQPEPKADAEPQPQQPPRQAQEPPAGQSEPQSEPQRAPAAVAPAEDAGPIAAAPPEPNPEPAVAPEPDPEPVAEQPQPQPQPQLAAAPTAPTPESAVPPAPAPQDSAAEPPVEPLQPKQAPQAEQPAPESAPAPAQAPQPSPSNPERLAPSTSLAGSARDQVRADGSLLQPKPRGPLAGLREKLGG